MCFQHLNINTRQLDGVINTVAVLCETALYILFDQRQGYTFSSFSSILAWVFVTLCNTFIAYWEITYLGDFQTSLCWISSFLRVLYRLFELFFFADWLQLVWNGSCAFIKNEVPSSCTWCLYNENIYQEYPTWTGDGKFDLHVCWFSGYPCVFSCNMLLGYIGIN